MKWKNVDCTKKQLKEIDEALADLERLHSTHIEIWNHKDWKTGEIKDEEMTFQVFPSTTQRPEISKLYDEVGNKYHWQATKETTGQIITDLKEAIKKGWAFVPTVDKRSTSEEFEERERKQKEEQKKREEFKAKCLPIPEGKAGVCLAICYDDSDPMTDYYSPHRTVETFILALIDGKARETQALARSIVNRYDKLQGIDWDWKTEKWSMGHGNYLISKNCPEKRNIRGEERACHYEIVFTSGDYLAHPDYPGKSLNISLSEGNGHKPEIRHNQDKNGLELIFDTKPDQDIINWLKSNGFRWSFKNRLWYSRYSEDLKKTVEGFFNKEDTALKWK